VTGGTSLAYTVAPGVAVTSKGDSDGKTLSYFEGGTTAAVSGGDASNSRIDAVYLYASDLTQGDADNLVHLGVVEGTPSSTPAVPDIPTYGTLLQEMVLPSGATTTEQAAQAISVPFAIPFGASLGRLAVNTNTQNGNGDGNVNTYYVEQAVSFHLPTDRLVEFRFDVCASASDGDYSTWYQGFMLDGTEIPNSGGEFSLGESYQLQTHTYDYVVSAGDHTAAVRTGLRDGSAPQFHFTGDQYVTFIGRVFSVFDRGVAV